MLKGPQGEEQEIESRPEEVAIIYRSTTAPPRGESASQDWVSYVLSPTNLVLFRRGTIPATLVPGLWTAPRWHHARPTHCENPPGWNISP